MSAITKSDRDEPTNWLQRSFPVQKAVLKAVLVQCRIVPILACHVYSRYFLLIRASRTCWSTFLARRAVSFVTDSRTEQKLSPHADLHSRNDAIVASQTENYA